MTNDQQPSNSASPDNQRSSGTAPVATDTADTDVSLSNVKPAETGGPKGLEPTRYGDWEQNGRCTDF